MTINPGLFSSKSTTWETPQDLFLLLDMEFLFQLDVCANGTNSKCKHYFSPEQNGLTQMWSGTCWMNPPYGKEIGRWIEKAYQSSLLGATVVCLLPCRTDTKWWHCFCMRAAEIRFIKGRLRFGGMNKDAPFPSAIVIFRYHEDQMSTPLCTSFVI